jgi:HEAT repeat protein
MQLAERLAQASDDEADAILARLSEIGPEARAALPAMVHCLRKSEFKLEIVGALAALRGEALPALRPLLRDEDSKIRYWALCALDDMGVDAEPAAADVLPLLEDEDLEVRQKAIETLADPRLPPRQTVPALVAQLQQDDQIGARAAGALGDLGAAARDAIPALVEMAKSHTGPSARYRAFEALARIDKTGEFSVPVLARALRDRGSYGFMFRQDINDLAASELAELGVDVSAAVPALMELLKDDALRDDVVLYEAVSHALAVSGSKAKEAIPILRRDMVTPPPRGGAFGTFVPPDYGKTCLRVFAAKALAKLDPTGHRAFEILNEVLCDARWTDYPRSPLGATMPAYPDPRTWACMGLAYLKGQSDEAVPALVAAMEKGREEKSQLAGIAAWALAEADRKDRSCLPVLKAHHLLDILAFYRESPDDVVEVLGERIHEIVPQLIDAAFTPEYQHDTRRYIADILERTEPNQIPQLVARSFQVIQAPVPKNSFRSPNYGIYVLRTLGHRAAPALPAVLQYLGADDHIVRAEAAWLVGAIAEQPEVSVPALAAKLTDPRVLVRARAARALGRFGPKARSVEEALRRAASDDFYSVRIAAMTAIEEIEHSRK